MNEAPPDAASLLLIAERKTAPFERSKVRAHPVVFAAANLFFCGAMDHLLKEDPGGHYLSLFLFIEASICFLFSIGFHFQSLREILVKTSVFPATGWDRFLFTVVCIVRKPLTLALWLTAGLFMIVFYRRSPSAAAFGVALFSMMLLDTILLGSIMALLSIRSVEAMGALFFAIALAMIFLLVGAMVFHTGGILGALPVVSWAASGITAAEAGNGIGAASNFLYLLAMMVAGVVIGKRIA